MSTNLTRISGMASGMDTESMVKQLVQSKKAKLDVFAQSKTKSEWRQEAYHKINKSIANFILDSRKKLGLTNYTYIGQLKAGSIEQVDWAKKAILQNEDFFSAKASASASGEYDIQVQELASNATITGKAVENIKASDKIGGNDRTISININGEVKNIDIKADDTITDAIKKIKNATDLNISFGRVGQNSSGETTSMLFVSSKQSGNMQSIQTNDQNALELFKKLGVDESILQTGVKGKNSKIIVNGSLVENETNEVNINGLNLSLKKVSNTSQKVSITTDTQGIFDKIKEFVDGYNKVIGELQDKIKEKTYRSYHPLTKEQKEAMKEDDVKLWEEKARSGLLSNDSSIKNMISNIRTGAYEKVEGANYMYDLGITTGSFKNGAKFDIDEQKLKDAIAKDPQKVLETLFKAPEDITNYKINKNDSQQEIERKRAGLKAQRENTGVFIRIMGDMSDGIENMAKKSGAGKDSNLLKDVRSNMLAEIITNNSVIEREIRIFDRKIDDENKKINDYENKLWKKFSAMEKAIQKMNSQSNWIAQQFMG